MKIEKKQTEIDNFRLEWHFFSAAREALKYILKNQVSGKKVLIPAYIGYSSREGSGVFDPIRSTGTPYEFYSMDGHLNIDLADITKKIKSNDDQALLLIHYFGFKDDNIDRVKRLARKRRMVIIEDFAHAFYSFWKDPKIDFDFAIFSDHKMFPIRKGGALLSGVKIERKPRPASCNYFSYSIPSISQKRIENYLGVLENINKIVDEFKIEILRTDLKGFVPQTFPVLLESEKVRDLLYFELNKKGYGVVSLYHQLISQIPERYACERNISSRILNLPVHQDANRGDLDRLIREMTDILKKERNLPGQR